LPAGIRKTRGGSSARRTTALARARTSSMCLAWCLVFVVPIWLPNFFYASFVPKNGEWNIFLNQIISPGNNFIYHCIPRLMPPLGGSSMPGPGVSKNKLMGSRENKKTHKHMLKVCPIVSFPPSAFHPMEYAGIVDPSTCPEFFQKSMCTFS
jgi:hypothetical protein